MTLVTETLPITEATFEDVTQEAGRYLREGKLVAFPTETVYGLGVNLDDPKAVERLYQVKGRPKDKQLTLTIADFSDLERYHIALPKKARALATCFWPGPLTLITKKENGETLGIRMPGHPVARKVIQAARVPVGLPSANPSGEPPPRSGEEVLRYFQGSIDLLVDGGKTSFGVSSTVVCFDQESWTIQRQGAIPVEEIEKVCHG